MGSKVMDIVERLRTGHVRYGTESEQSAAKRRLEERAEAADEIERLREALKEIDKAIETWLPDHSPMRQALQNFTRSALQQKDTE